MLGEYLGAGASTTKLLLHLNGNSTDSSGNGNNGTGYNIDYVNGKFGQAASFNSTSDYIEIQNESAFDFERNMPFTISLWATFNSSSVYRYFVTKDNSGGVNNSLIFYVTSYNRVMVKLINTNDTNNIIVYTSNTFTSTSNFRNFICTYDGSSRASGVFIYVNGAAEATITSGDNLTASILNNAPVTIGNMGGSRNFDGLIDEVIWENVVWTPEYIKKYYTYSKGRFGIL